MGVPVVDQDRALEFYVGTLGFEKRMDVPIGHGARWIVVAPATAATTIALVRSSEEIPAGVETGIRFVAPEMMYSHLVRRHRGIEAVTEMERVICLYCGHPVAVDAMDLPLSFREDPATTARPRQFVIVGAGLLLHRCEIARDVEAMADPLFFSGVVHQAAGIVSVQADISTTAALNLLMDTALAAEATLEQVAESVVNRTVRFDPPN